MHGPWSNGPLSRTTTRLGCQNPKVPWDHVHAYLKGAFALGTRQQKRRRFITNFQEHTPTLERARGSLTK